MCAVYNRQSHHRITIITATADITRWPVQMMCRILIIKRLCRSRHSSVAYRTVFYRCETIQPFCTHRTINCIKHKVQMSWQKRWSDKRRHRCTIMWPLPAHRHRCSRLVANAWHTHRHHHVGKCHRSIAAATVTPASTLSPN